MKSALAGILFTACLLIGAPARAQAPGACVEKCGQAMGECMSRCGADTKCTGRCTKRMGDCQSRCSPPKDLGKQKCTGPNGKPTPCPEYKKGPNKPTPEGEDNEQYPNKAAKDLAKDPAYNFTP